MSEDPGQSSGQQTPGPVGTDPHGAPPRNHASEGSPVVAYDIDGNPMPDFDVERGVQAPSDQDAPGRTGAGGSEGLADSPPEDSVPAGSAAPGEGVPVAYDPEGRPLPAYDAHGRPLLTFDAHGRPLTAYDAHGRPMPGYDAQGRPLPGFGLGVGVPGYPPPGYYGAMPPPPPPPPPADVAKRITRLGRRAMWLGAISLIFALFFYPLGIVAGVAGLVLGLLALRAARPYRAKAPGAVPGVVTGVIGLVFSLMITAFAVYLYDEISTYSKCRDAANTIADENQCKDNFARGLEKKLHLRPGTVNARNMPF